MPIRAIQDHIPQTVDIPPTVYVIVLAPRRENFLRFWKEVIKFLIKFLIATHHYIFVIIIFNFKPSSNIFSPRSMDKDKNGMLGEKEQKNIRRVVKRNRLKISGIKKCIRRFFDDQCDLNQDGAVDSAEFQKCVAT